MIFCSLPVRDCKSAALLLLIGAKVINIKHKTLYAADLDMFTCPPLLP
jgi:hypothetical protein